VKAMYTGTMIDDLIQAVAHAEEHAQAQVQPTVWVAPAPAPQPQVLRPYVDSYSGSMVGVA
jgi:hypothetical protein